MVRIFFANLHPNCNVNRQNHAANGGAAWITPPPPILYDPAAIVPHGNPWNNPAGRTGTANIPVGGSVTMDYLVLSGPPNPTATITVQAFAGAPGQPARPTVQWTIAGGVVAHTHHITQAGNDFDIVINFH